MIRSLALGTLAIALTACDSPKPAEERAIRRWLLCEECVEGELDSVVALGSRGEKAMRRALKGPPDDRLANMRRQAEAMYARIPNPGISRQKYVEHYTGNYVASYQSRAVVALTRFNTPSAHAALVDALRNDAPYRQDVRRILGKSVGAVSTVVAGDSQHAPLDSLVRVDPTILVRDSITARALSNVRVIFRVDSGGGRVIDSVRFTDGEGKAAVRWQLGPSDSVNVVAVLAAGQTLRIRALGHPYGNRVVFLMQPNNARIGQPIPPPPRIAVQDAWGTTQSSFNRDAVVSVQGTNTQAAYNIVGGLATISDLRVFSPGSGFRLRVSIAGVPPASSARFDVTP